MTAHGFTDSTVVIVALLSQIVLTDHESMSSWPFSMLDTALL